MRFRAALPLLPSFGLAILVGAYLWIDDTGEKHSHPAAPKVLPRDHPPAPDAQLATLEQTVSAPAEGSTEVAKLQQTVQALQSANKSLSDQVGALAARLENLEKARAEVRERPRDRARRR